MALVHFPFADWLMIVDSVEALDLLASSSIAFSVGFLALSDYLKLKSQGYKASLVHVQDR